MGLVDYLGGLPTAVDLAKRMAGLGALPGSSTALTCAS